MLTLFINLDAAVQRRQDLEANFHRFAPDGWGLLRVPARTAESVARIAGSRRPSEKACLLSHMDALRRSLEEEGPVLILEDDAMLGPNTGTVLPPLLEIVPESTDLVYLSVLAGDVSALMLQFSAWRQLARHGRVGLIEVAQLGYCGADSYLVRPSGKKKILELLGSLSSIDIPYDLLLRQWVGQGKLRALLAFPFLTSLSAHADTSANGNSNIPLLAYNSFRRLMCIDAATHPGSPTDAIESLCAAPQEPIVTSMTRIMQVLLAHGVTTPDWA